MKDGRRNLNDTAHPAYGCRRRLSLWFDSGSLLRLRGAAA